MSDFSSQINDLIEYKKLVVKLEESLKSKEEENQKISKANSDVKDLIEEMKSELNEQNQKILRQYSEIKNITKKYESEINNLNIAHENEKQKYDEKIMELSAYNPHNQEIKIKNDLESKYKIIIKNKDLQISNLNEEINELKENLSLKEKELNILKINLNEQLYTERETHSYQMKDLLSKISNQNQLEKAYQEKEILEEFKLNTKQNEEKTNRLYKELDDLRTEKAQNEIKYNKDIFELDTKLKEQMNNNQILNDNINDVKEVIEKLKMLLLDKDYEINKLSEENKKINQEKEGLMIYIKEKENLIEGQIKGLNDLKKNYKKITKDINSKTEENKNLQKKIMELEEEKKNKQKKQNNDNALLNSTQTKKENENLYENAYEEIREKYRSLILEQKRKNEEIKNKNEEIKSKNEEIKNLNKYLKQLKKGNLDNNYKNEDLVKKFREINQKKNYYKQQCKNANKYIMKLFNILTNEQKQYLESNGIMLSNINNNNEINSESSKDN